VRDGIDTQHRIETAVLKGQHPSTISKGEVHPIRKPARGRVGPRVCNSAFLSVYSNQPTSSAFNERQRRTPWAAADIEDIAGFPNSSKFSNFGLLGSSAPTLLPNISAEGFTPHLWGDLAPKRRVLDRVKVGTLFVVIGHCTLL
jgi:hypothetical protein